MRRPPARSIAVETLERRALFTGVTLVTHGFGGSADDWVTAMGNLIAQQSGPLASQPRYRMTVTDTGTSGGPITVTSTRVTGAPAPAQWGSREIIVLLDWSALAGSLTGGHARTTADVATAVANKLLATFSIPDLPVPLAQLPIHLLGHSRGASLVSEIARGLGQRGAWVDQVSYFDPHPVDGVREPPFGPNYGDAAMRVYDNVVFAENYWRTDGPNSFDFTGEAVNGAYNLQLTESVLSGTGYSNDHSDTHLFYHGTIGKPGGPFANGDGGATIGASWYSPPHPSRETTGWRYSRIAASGTRPAAGSKFNGAWRDALALTATGANVWDNAQISGLLSDFTLVQGTPITVPLQFADLNRDATVTVGFDRDDDPYNGVFNTGATFATSAVSGDASLVDVPTTGVAGAFRIYARIGNGVNARYYYAPARAIVTAAGFDETWIGPPAGNWSDAANWSAGSIPSPSDAVAIYASAVTLAANARIAGLHLNSSAKLDLLNHSLIVDYAPAAASPLASLTSKIITGRGPAGEWNSSAGILSSVAAATAGLTTLAIAEAPNVLSLESNQTMLWQGMTADATSVLLRYTYDGDANLDGFISGDDYSSIDFNVGTGATGYSNGDFNYDGIVSGDDYSTIDFNFAAQGNPL
ncbi:MAG: hypothetical protein QOF78_1522 [Phycisphaerales bacterium]|jgi:hypothetical protein|nr:hypothetical protein [Phycisphaerales bacterium]